MAGQNVDLFDAYFRRADLDRDGRISGNEAVSFFLGSNLPKPVLAQVLRSTQFFFSVFDPIRSTNATNVDALIRRGVY